MAGDPSTSPVRIGDNLGWGAGWGFLFGVVYSLYVVLLVTTQGTEAVTAYGISPRDQVLVYLFSGTIGGALVGLVRPYLRYTVVLIPTGILIGLQFAVFLQMATSGDPVSGWDSEAVERIFVMGSIWGVMGSLILRYAVFRDRSVASSRSSGR